MLFATLLVQQPAFDFDVTSGGGLNMKSDGVPVIRGSWFQYYERGWTKGYYSSDSQTQKVERIDGNTVQLTFVGANGRAQGKQIFKRSGDTLRATYHFEWSGDAPVMIEAAVGQIWAPAFENGSLVADGKPTRSLKELPKPSADEVERRFSSDAQTYAFRSPFAGLTMSSNRPITLFDARNGYPQGWAEGKQLWWAGVSDAEVSKEKPLDFSVEWKLVPVSHSAGPAHEESIKGTPVADALHLPDQRWPLVPQPTEAVLNYSQPIAFSMNHAFPAGRFRFFNEFIEALQRRFELPKVSKSDPLLEIDGGVHHMRMRPGAYTIDIKGHSISVLGEEEEGLRMGLQRLAQLVYVKDGKLLLPTGRIVDNPKTEFRGVHLFVGREALAFQKKLWDRVLRPMGFNRVVLQCEQTQWDALGGNFSAISMPKPDLAKLFNQYRNMSVEPIPLIQSFGHMEWLFANKQRLDLAFNPTEPYAIDPRKPDAQAKVAEIWDEAIALLKPKTIHFGLDEVDMRGHAKSDPPLVTEMWQKQLAFLGDYAQKKSVKMMIWGDKALAPGEAPDAALGDNAWEAERRRAAIPKGTVITDWHYKADSRPKTFYPVLQLWKSSEMKPIAAAWYRPENIRGFNLAAVLEGCGTLQTTWAGYESSEEAMLRALPQFTAMVLAADFSWSGRQDEIKNLDYDPAEVFRRLYFGQPLPVVPKSGEVCGKGEVQEIDGVRYQFFEKPFALETRLADAAETTSALSLSLEHPAREIALCLSTASKCDDGDPVALLSVIFEKGNPVQIPIIYGRHVRASDDSAMVAFASRKGEYCSLRPVFEPGRNIVRIKLEPKSAYAGLKLHGLTLIR